MVFCNEYSSKWDTLHCKGHNPYFNRWFSAIKDINKRHEVLKSHNPYFNRWFSAIKEKRQKGKRSLVTILILIDGFLQYKKNINYNFFLQ